MLLTVNTSVWTIAQYTFNQNSCTNKHLFRCKNGQSMIFRFKGLINTNLMSVSDSPAVHYHFTSGTLDLNFPGKLASWLTKPHVVLATYPLFSRTSGRPPRSYWSSVDREWARGCGYNPFRSQCPRRRRTGRTRWAGSRRSAARLPAPPWDSIPLECKHSESLYRRPGTDTGSDVLALCNRKRLKFQGGRPFKWQLLRYSVSISCFYSLNMFTNLFFFVRQKTMPSKWWTWNETLTNKQRTMSVSYW